MTSTTTADMLSQEMSPCSAGSWGSKGQMSQAWKISVEPKPCRCLRGWRTHSWLKRQSMAWPVRRLRSSLALHSILVILWTQSHIGRLWQWAPMVQFLHLSHVGTSYIYTLSLAHLPSKANHSCVLSEPSTRLPPVHLAKETNSLWPLVWNRRDGSRKSRKIGRSEGWREGRKKKYQSHSFNLCVACEGGHLPEETREAIFTAEQMRRCLCTVCFPSLLDCGLKLVRETGKNKNAKTFVFIFLPELGFHAKDWTNKYAMCQVSRVFHTDKILCNRGGQRVPISASTSSNRHLDTNQIPTHCHAATGDETKVVAQLVLMPNMRERESER